jgi:ferredoxin
MIARIDAATCRGHGQCELIAPDVFELGDDDRGHVIADLVPPGSEEAARDAVLMCPEGAVEVTGD